jgi:hypothetical protein
MGKCPYSFHDLSRVELSHGVPRFNMPFELGLAVEMSHRQKHRWFVFESKPYRLPRSLSDLNGTDPLIHDGRPEGLLRALADVFDAPGVPNVPLEPIFQLLRGRALALKGRYGGLYTRGAFGELVTSATELATRVRHPAAGN